MSLVELCHKIQPAAPGLVSVLVQEEGDAAQCQQVPSTGRDISSFGLTSLAQAVEGVEIPTRFHLKKNLSAAGWHNCPGCCLSRN